MSKLFLNNTSIDLNDFDTFKEGMNNLMVIDKRNDHIFYKHDSVYNVPILNTLYTTYGNEEQAISKFLEQGFSPCDSCIDTEEKANKYCDSNYNAFLGIDFSSTQITSIKQIVDNCTYIEWENSNLSIFNLFLNEIGECIHNKAFDSEFNSLQKEVQKAILEKVKFCKSRGLETALSPGTQAIKNVTMKSFDFKVMELRISSPLAIRIYFSEFNGKVFLGSLEQKSNPDQNEDIIKAYKIIKQFLQN